MDEARARQVRAELIAQHGPWTAHNMHLVGDLYTIDGDRFTDEIKLRRIVQIVADTVNRPLADLRVLDLGCLEGMYAAEFARHGATAVGVEGRTANIAKADFAREVFGLPNLSFVQDDVRNVSKETYGEFDVVLCLGLLYHLEADSVFNLVARIAAMCRHVAVFDTHIAMRAREVREYQGVAYAGDTVGEFPEGMSVEEQATLPWTSMGNPVSFWPTRPSLHNLLGRAGFTSVYECSLPYASGNPADRVTVVALNGHKQRLETTPNFNEYPLLYWPNEVIETGDQEAAGDNEPAERLAAEVRERQRIQDAYDVLERRVLEQDQYIRHLQATLEARQRLPRLLGRLVRR